MRSKVFALFALLGLSQACFAQTGTISINAVNRDGFGGVYEIDESSGVAFDGGRYWWMCIEPNGSRSAGPVEGGFIADSISFAEGWDQMNTERLTNYTNNPGLYLALATQVRVMEYVLDTYLPWTTLAGPSGRFAEQDADPALYGSNTDFYNAFFTVQNFLSETYGKTNKTDFTNMADYTFFAGNATDPASILSRNTLFATILSDVEGKASTNFFDTYTAQRGYMIANTLFSETDPDNWQDALIIYDFVPVPEPSGALLIACTGLAVMLRRFRRLA